MENIKEHLNWRYGVKRYDSTKKVQQQDMDKLQDAIRLAPSSYGLQPYKVLFIEDPDVRAKLSVASFHQPQVTEASCLIVFAIETTIDETFIDNYFSKMCSTRGIKLEGILEKHRNSVVNAISRKQNDEKLSWATHQAYLALGFLLMAAAEMKIDANAMEGFMPYQYDEILGLKQKGLHAVVIAAVGYRHPEDFYQHMIKVRKPNNELFIKI
ncbi:Nitroreductase [Mucilaginibacter pineti]|uniref:Nitroreductase n=1 Tax=Mucilaginibacter pineti TaxID=1391627 RepID=A0A1G7HEM3_9SPHI|nr:NAD(P)H-dependent oxidoreductase [Mucilaginibacter pineti]SDE98786.1 Nitroreductase [Mucilaginibacter pineti]